jgi:hypothetical protein
MKKTNNELTAILSITWKHGSMSTCEVAAYIAPTMAYLTVAAKRLWMLGIKYVLTW